MEYLDRTRKKCCFVGDFGVGKTSIIFSYLSKSLEDIQTTLGIDFFSKTIRIREQDVHLTIWDTAGSERFHSLLHSYLRDSDIIIIVYDLSRQDPNLTFWLRIVEQHQPNVVGILGNKSDLTQSCPNDLSDVLYPYKRQNWNIICGKCSSRDKKSIQGFLTKCMKPTIRNAAEIPVKITPIKVPKKKMGLSMCCA
jgi:small GTP-binding protein